jgi:hypothetical protein
MQTRFYVIILSVLQLAWAGRALAIADIANATTVPHALERLDLLNLKCGPPPEVHRDNQIQEIDQIGQIKISNGFAPPDAGTWQGRASTTLAVLMPTIWGSIPCLTDTWAPRAHN